MFMGLDFEVLTLPFMYRPLIVLAVLSIVGGLVGTIINLRRVEFNAEATVHSLFPGIVAGAVFGGTQWIVPAAALTAVCVVIALSLAGRRGHNEAGTAVILTSFFALGVVLVLYKSDMSGQLEAIMFGRLLEMTTAQLWQSGAVLAVAAVAILSAWQWQVAVAFDRTTAAAMEIPVKTVDYVLNATIAAVVVAASTAVGVLLVIGFLVVPGAAGRLVARTVTTQTLVAVLTALLGSALGVLVILTDAPVSPQASVALGVVVVFLLLWAVVRR